MLAALVFTDNVNLGLAITITIVINAVIWLISPWISDLSLRWFNKHGVPRRRRVARRAIRACMQLIHDVADQYGFSAPRLGLIPDRNPTAFTYGLLRNNARIVVTDGIFEFLNEDEQRAVVAHELGHIVNRDFIVMTAAGTLVQILYQVYAASMRSSREQRRQEQGRPGAASASPRSPCTTSASTCSITSAARANTSPTPSRPSSVEARHLASALVKIAYGIVQVEDTDATPRRCCRRRGTWASSTCKNARYSGLEAESSGLQSAERASEAMLFDAHNPWARLIELNSTHPLTGMRIAHLGDIAQQKAQPFPDYDLKAAALRVRLDKGALWSQFWRELGILAHAVRLGVVAGRARRLAARPRRRSDRRARHVAAALSFGDARADDGRDADDQSRPPRPSSAARRS